MNRVEKNNAINAIAEQLTNNNNFYLTDILGLTVKESNTFRKICYSKNVSLQVVKNTLLKKAMEKVDRDYEGLYDVLKGNTSIMFTETGNTPARMIKEFRKKYKKPLLKAAYIEEQIYIGDDLLDILSSIKSKNELLADIILLLQSPTKNVISALQSSQRKLSGIIKTLSEK